MMTSYFANKAAAADPNAVSISRWPPRWWDGRRRYVALAPPGDLVKRAKAGLPWTEFSREYRRDVLAKLDPAKVFEELSEAVLCCWERPGENCHRRLVAQWIEKAMGVKVPELLADEVYTQGTFDDLDGD